MIHNGAVLEEGKWCENAICDILKRAGVVVSPSTPRQDHVQKVDFWAKIGGRELPIQFSTNRSAIVGVKGIDALRRGVVPSWVDPLAIESAVETGNAKPVADQFMAQVEAVLRNFPRFQPIMRHA